MLLNGGKSLQQPQSKQRVILALYRGELASAGLDKLQSSVSNNEISQDIHTINQT